MDDAALVRVMQRFAGGDEDRGRVGERHRRAELGGAGDQPRQVLAADVLHGEVVAAVVDAEVVDVDDVRMVELRRQARLVEEHVDEIGLRGEVRQNTFHREALLEAARTGPPRQEHLGHPADG